MDSNPAGPDLGPGRVIRGGSYLCHESYLLSVPRFGKNFQHLRHHHLPHGLPRGDGLPMKPSSPWWTASRQSERQKETSGNER